MKETKSLHLQLFEGKDNFNYEVLNDNMEKIDDAHGAVNEYDYYETLMKNATFQCSMSYGKWAIGQISGFALFLQSTYDANDKYQIIVSNGVETLRLDCRHTSNGITAYFSDGEELITIKASGTSADVAGLWEVTLNNKFYNARTEDVKITVLHKLQDEKILVKSDDTPLTKPLILDTTINYEVLPFKGDEALQAIIDGRQILIRVPNADGGNYTAIYMPVIQYQLPNQENDFLYLIYMNDGIAANFMTAMQTGNFDALYGQLKLKLSKTYNETPLK